MITDGYIVSWKYTCSNKKASMSALRKQAKNSNLIIVIKINVSSKKCKSEIGTIQAVAKKTKNIVSSKEVS